jgi:hypothetical protein
VREVYQLPRRRRFFGCEAARAYESADSPREVREITCRSGTLQQRILPVPRLVGTVFKTVSLRV